MAPRRKISPRQIILLIEFAEGNRDIALGRFAPPAKRPLLPQGSKTAQRAWESLASQLNAVAEGCTKTADQWRRYWIEFKAKTKAKAADSRRMASGTCGGPNKVALLTEAQERVLAIIGKVAVEGLTGVQPSDDSESHSTTTAEVPSMEGTTTENVDPSSIVVTVEDPHSELLEPSMEEEWLEEERMDEGLLPPSKVPASVPSSSSALPPTRDRSPLHAIASERRQRQRSQRRFHRDERVPQWAYELEESHIASQERMSAAVELLAANLDQRLGAIQTLLVSLVEALTNKTSNR